MTTVGKVGSAPAHSQAAPSQTSEPEKPKTPKEEFHSLLNAWAHTLPVAFVNKLEDFSAKHIK